MDIVKKYYGFIVVLALSFFTIQPLLIPGFFPIHDNTQVQRVYEMGKSLSDLMFPVRWIADLGYGYGYPIFNFYAPLAYYVGGVLTLFGFDALVSTKIMMGLGIVLAGIFMYLLAREFFGELGGLVSGLFYLYAPYHAVDIYVRGDVAESWAYAFIPLAFYGLWKTYNEEKWRYVVIGSLGYAGVILSHNLTAMMFTPFLIIVLLLYCFIAYRKKKLFTIYYLLFTIFAGLLISSFYWLPALLEMKYTNVFSQIGGGADFRDHFVCIEQLWDSQWGFGGSTKGCVEDGLSLKIGKFYIAVSLLSFGVLYWVRKEKRLFFAIIFAVLFLAISVFLMLEFSKAIWETVPLMAFFQYPWRFLILASFAASFLSGSVIWSLNTFAKNLPYFNTLLYLIVAVIIGNLLYFNIKLFSPQTILSKSVNDYTNVSNLKWTTSKISDEYMPKDFVKPKEIQGVSSQRLIVKEGVAKIVTKNSLTQKIQANVDVSEVSVIHVNITPFPAWKFLVNQRPYDPISSKNGYDIGLPKGQHILDVWFQETKVERISGLLSLLGFSILILGIIRVYISKRGAL